MSEISTPEPVEAPILTCACCVMKSDNPDLFVAPGRWISPMCKSCARAGDTYGWD